jgi:deoxyribonuclease-4
MLDQGAALLAALPDVPVLMETPYATPEVDVEQVRIVKKLAGGLPLSPYGV